MLVQIKDGELIHGRETAVESSKIPAVFQQREVLRKAAYAKSHMHHSCMVDLESGQAN